MTNVRKSVLGLAALLATAMAAPAAFAQSSANVSTTGSATIFQPIAVAKTADLSFGVIVRPISGSATVTVPAGGGARTSTGSVALLDTAGFPAAARAGFTVTGEGGQAFNVGIPASFTMTRSGGGTLNVNLLSSTAAATLSNALGATGTQTFFVGGTITNIADTTASGNYTGSFLVTVTYQ